MSHEECIPGFLADAKERYCNQVRGWFDAFYIFLKTGQVVMSARPADISAEEYLAVVKAGAAKFDAAAVLSIVLVPKDRAIVAIYETSNGDCKTWKAEIRNHPIRVRDFAEDVRDWSIGSFGRPVGAVLN